MSEKKTGMLKRLANFFAPKRKKIESEAHIPKQTLKARPDAGATTPAMNLQTLLAGMNLNSISPKDYGMSGRRKGDPLHSERKKKVNRLAVSRKTKLRHKRLRKSA